MMSLWIAIGALSTLALISGVVLGFAARRFQVESDPVVEQVEAILPQSQCGQCGYLAVAPMLKPSPAMAKKSINALPAASK